MRQGTVIKSHSRTHGNGSVVPELFEDLDQFVLVDPVPALVTFAEGAGQLLEQSQRTV